MELKKSLRRHKDMIKGNSSSILSISSRLQNMGMQNSMQNVSTVEALDVHRQHLLALEEEVVLLKNSLKSLSQSSTSPASNQGSAMEVEPGQLREDETVQQSQENVEIDKSLSQLDPISTQISSN